jgi:2-amino-4-hydroxy-6-hydroxymethyldihydropteridine diphosphokinase
LPLAAIALGSNLGDREATLASSVRLLAALGEVLAVSSNFDTDPVGYADQPRFLNAAALLQTSLAPLDLLRALLAIEEEHGRDRSHGIEKGPRTLDLDLLLYDDVILTTAELTLPHPELHRRRFVLDPLAEVAPAMMHPVLHRTVADLLRDSDRAVY